MTLKEINGFADIVNNMGANHGLDRQHQIYREQAWWRQI